MNSIIAVKAVQVNIFAKGYEIITKAKKNPEEKTNSCEIK